ncbi:MAG: sensor histidine kinase [Terriglobales bacterium]
MILRNNSISSRVSWMILLVSGGALVVACLAFIGYDRTSVREAMVRNLSTQSQIIGANSTSAITFGDPQAAESTLSALRSAPSVISAGIVTPSGQMFAQYRRDGAANEVVVLPKIEASANEAHEFQPEALLLARKIYLQGQWIGTVYIRSDYSVLQRQSKRYMGIAGTVLLLSLLAAWLFALPLRRSLTEPIVDLAAAAKGFSEDPQSGVRASSTSDLAEMSVLVNAFNNMLEQIKGREAALKEAQAGLEQKVEDRTRQLIATNRELEAFSYSVSHDLRAPLETINGFSYMFLTEYGKQTGKGAEYIQQIQEASRRMGELIEDLLKLSHAASSTMHHESVDLSEMARQIGTQLSRKESTRAVTFVIADHLRAVGDSRLLKIALENLFQNAWKYTSAHPKATIQFGSKMHNGLETFFIRDDGAGFDPGMADLLFKPFRRLHSMAEFPGTGVGLATVQRILHRHEGFIWAEGQVEKGATFYFTIGTRRVPDATGTSATSIWKKAQGS